MHLRNDTRGALKETRCDTSPINILAFKKKLYAWDLHGRACPCEMCHVGPPRVVHRQSSGSFCRQSSMATWILKTNAYVEVRYWYQEHRHPASELHKILHRHQCENDDVGMLYPH